jgi:hypothetical protein
MTEQQQYLHNRVRIGWGILVAGLVIFAAGLALQLFFTLPFNTRIISGLGIFAIGLGVAQIVRYRAVIGNPRTAARLVNEERDERVRMIRARAGNRAFWLSLVMTYALLMWVSMASNGSLPEIGDDALWYYLASTVILPFALYVGSLVYDQRNG